MSERFGLNWREQDAVRMQYFIHALEVEAEESDPKKKRGSSQGEFRQRM